MRWKIREDFPIDYRSYRLSPPEYLRYLLQGMLAAAVFVFTFYRSLTLFLASLPLMLFYPFLQCGRLARRRQQRLLREFQEALGVLHSFLSAGYSVENAFRRVRPELWQLLGEDAILLGEWDIFLKAMELNQPLENALRDFSLRSGLDDIQNFSEVFLLARRSGGELSRILGNTTGIIREKLMVAEEVLTMNADKRYEQKIMNLIPFLLIWYMNLSSPDFFSVLYSTLAGRICMTLCLLLYLLACYLSERILDIEV